MNKLNDDKGPWRDCKLIEQECRVKGRCIGHTAPPSGQTVGGELDDIMLMIDNLDCGDPKHYRRQEKIRAAIATHTAKAVERECSKRSDDIMHRLADTLAWHVAQGHIELKGRSLEQVLASVRTLVESDRMDAQHGKEEQRRVLHQKGGKE